MSFSFCDNIGLHFQTHTPAGVSVLGWKVKFWFQIFQIFNKVLAANISSCSRRAVHHSSVRQSISTSNMSQSNMSPQFCLFKVTDRRSLLNSVSVIFWKHAGCSHTLDTRDRRLVIHVSSGGWDRSRRWAYGDGTIGQNKGSFQMRNCSSHFVKIETWSWPQGQSSKCLLWWGGYIVVSVVSVLQCRAPHILEQHTSIKMTV